MSDEESNTHVIELTHIGERLIAAMFNRSSEVRARLAERLGADVVRRRAVPEVPLSSYGTLRFDGASCIDIALVDTESCSVFACEAKLGTTGLGGQRFAERFLGDCETSHRGSRIRGSMPAILERNGLPAVAPEARLQARVRDGERSAEHAVESR